MLSKYPLTFSRGLIAPSPHEAIMKFRRDFVLAYGASPVLAGEDFDFAAGDLARFGDCAERAQAKRHNIPFVPMDFNGVVEAQLTTATPSREPAFRIILLGGESTGKTTLAAQLASHYQSLWAPEYCRLHLEHAARGPVSADQIPIARGQYALQKAMLGFSTPRLISDTDLIMTMVYGEHFYSIPASDIEPLFTPRKEDCYLLLEPDLPWIADGMRDSPQARQKIHDDVKKISARYGLKLHDLRGVGPVRLQNAVKIIDATLNTY